MMRRISCSFEFCARRPTYDVPVFQCKTISTVCWWSTTESVQISVGFVRGSTPSRRERSVHLPLFPKRTDSTCVVFLFWQTTYLLTCYFFVASDAVDWRRVFGLTAIPSLLVASSSWIVSFLYFSITRKVSTMASFLDFCRLPYQQQEQQQQQQ